MVKTTGKMIFRRPRHHMDAGIRKHCGTQSDATKRQKRVDLVHRVTLTLAFSRILEDGEREKEKISIILVERMWGAYQGLSTLAAHGQAGNLQEIQRLHSASRKSKACHSRFSVRGNF
jgi:hypothetical protein